MAAALSRVYAGLCRRRLNPVPPVKDARENEGGTVDRSNEFEFPVS
jgi:hypothetical protein